jgi:hypothetical protein
VVRASCLYIFVRACVCVYVCPSALKYVRVCVHVWLGYPVCENNNFDSMFFHAQCAVRHPLLPSLPLQAYGCGAHYQTTPPFRRSRCYIGSDPPSAWKSTAAVAFGGRQFVAYNSSQVVDMASRHAQELLRAVVATKRAKKFSSLLYDFSLFVLNRDSSVPLNVRYATLDMRRASVMQATCVVHRSKQRCCCVKAE